MDVFGGYSNDMTKSVQDAGDAESGSSLTANAERSHSMYPAYRKIFKDTVLTGAFLNTVRWARCEDFRKLA